MENDATPQKAPEEAVRGRSANRPVGQGGTVYRLGRLRAVVAGALLWVSAAGVCAAQWQNGGSMAGQILDGDGAPVEHARLMVEALGTGTTYDLGTDAAGNFLLPQLAPGTYKVAVDAPGFAPWALPDVEIDAGQQRDLTPRLESLMAGRQRVSGAAVLSELRQQTDSPALEARQPGIRSELAPRDRMTAPVRMLGVVKPEQLYERLRNAQTVHAHVAVTTPQGVVEAEIAEQPVVPVQSTDWAAFEPGRGQQVSGPAGQRVSESAARERAVSQRAVSEEVARGQRESSKSAGQQGSESALVRLGASERPEATYAIPPVPPLNESMTVGDAQPAKPTPARAVEKSGAASDTGATLLAEAFAPAVPARSSEVAVQNVPDTDTNTGGGPDSAENGRVSAAGTQGSDNFSLFEPATEDIAESSQRSRREEGDALTVLAPRDVSRVHGQMFVEDRDAAWGAENAFTTLTTETSSGTFVTTPYKPPDRRLQGGLELGGPLGHGRGQWFVAVDALERNNPGMAVASEPSEFFAPLTATQLQTLQGRLQAGMSQVLDAGQANALYTQTMGQLDGMLGSVARSTQQMIAFPRFDWKVNERNRISAGYDFIRLHAMNGVQSAPTETWGVGSFGTRTLHLDAASAQLNTFFTPNLLNEARYTAAHDVQTEMPVAPTAFEQTLSQNAYDMPPQVSVASGSGGFRFGTPSYLDMTAYPGEFRQEAADTLTWMRGRNQVSAGYALQYVRDRISGLNYGLGGYTYSTREAFVADVLSPDHCDASTTGAGDLPCWSTFRQTVGPNTFAFDTGDYAGFATDTLKLGRGVTLSAGGRYDYEHLPKPDAALVNPDIPETATLPSEGNVSPRAGFAWALPWQERRPGATTVVRGGFGIFYGRISNAAVLAAISQTGTASAQRSYIFKPLDVGAPKFPYVFSPTPDLQIAPNATYFATDYQHARAMQAQLSVEQSLGRNTTLTLSYQGSFASHLPRIVDENIDLNAVGKISYTVSDPTNAGPLRGTYVSKFFYQRLNPDYQQLAEMQSTASARYQAVGASLRSRLPDGMLLTLDFRNGHALDDNPYAAAYNGRWNVLDPSDLALERGPSNEDIRDRLNGGLVLHEPWHASGWMGDVLGGYTMALSGGFRTGRPYTMRTVGAVPSFACSYQGWLAYGDDCVQHALPGVITSVPVAVSGLGDSLNGSGGGNWLPEIGRNTYRYPAAYNGNLRFEKRTVLGGRKALEFGADVSNFMNHSNVTHLETAGYVVSGATADTGAGKLTYLSGTNGHSQFGAVTTTNNNQTYRDRQIQLVLRLVF